MKYNINPSFSGRSIYLYLFLIFQLISCSVSHTLSRKHIAPQLSQVRNKIVDTVSLSDIKPVRVEHRGDSVFLVETQKVDGGQIASIKAETVKVVGGVKNIAERNGKVQIQFNIILPKCMMGSERNIVLFPILHKVFQTHSDSIIFKPISIRGETMDILQQREGWQMDLFYRRFNTSVNNAYNRFIRFPQLFDTKLDSIIQHPHEIKYYYHKEMPSTMISKRMSLTVSGKVCSIDGSVYNIPSKDTIKYIVSSMLSFADYSTKYKTIIVDKYVNLSKRFNIKFAVGSYKINQDDEELKQMMETQNLIKNNEEYEIDSLVLIASSSPEGSFSSNKLLSEKRACVLAKLIKPDRTTTITENWCELVDSIRVSELPSKHQLLNLISNQTKHSDNNSFDYLESKIKQIFPNEYRHIKENYYPSLRFVSTMYYLRRKGMEKDTIHLHEVDSIYMNGLKLLESRHYYEALEILRPYNDRNSAIALMSLGYDSEAKKIISLEPETDEREYLLAIICSRLNEIIEGRQHYLNSIRLNSRMEFRGNLDPEITKLIEK